MKGIAAMPRIRWPAVKMLSLPTQQLERQSLSESEAGGCETRHYSFSRKISCWISPPGEGNMGCESGLRQPPATREFSMKRNKGRPMAPVAMEPEKYR